jgi:hypothetical protein
LPLLLPGQERCPDMGYWWRVGSSVLGALVGLALGAAWGPGDPTVGVRGVGAAEFEGLLKRRPLRGGEAFAANVVVYPWERHYAVRFNRLTAGIGAEGWRYVPGLLEVENVYVSPTEPGEAGETIFAFLERVSAKYPHVTYRYAWWTEPQWWYTLWGAGGLVVVGVIWPAIRRGKGQCEEVMPPPTLPKAAQVEAKEAEAEKTAMPERETSSPRRYAGEFYPVARDELARSDGRRRDED